MITRLFVGILTPAIRATVEAVALRPDSLEQGGEGRIHGEPRASGPTRFEEVARGGEDECVAFDGEQGFPRGGRQRRGQGVDRSGAFFVMGEGLVEQALERRGDAIEA